MIILMSVSTPFKLSAYRCDWLNGLSENVENLNKFTFTFIIWVRERECFLHFSVEQVVFCNCMYECTSMLQCLHKLIHSYLLCGREKRTENLYFPCRFSSCYKKYVWCYFCSEQWLGWQIWNNVRMECWKDKLFFTLSSIMFVIKSGL